MEKKASEDSIPVSFGIFGHSGRETERALVFLSLHGKPLLMQQGNSSTEITRSYFC